MTPLSVNGKATAVDAEADTPLLWVLRDHLELSGTKFGCGMALCGACTVHVDGRPTRSCVTPVGTVTGRRITTIEGIGLFRTGKAVQDAWVAENVPQCGYCLSGQIMSATALLNSNMIRATRRSMRRWPATSAVVPPTRASAMLFTRQPTSCPPLRPAVDRGLHHVLPQH